MNHLSQYDILIVFMSHKECQWQSAPFPVNGALPLSRGDFVNRQIIAGDFQEIINAARKFYMTYNIRHVIGHKGSIHQRESPGFFTSERLIDDSMFVVTDLWDEAQLALLKLAIT